MPEHTISDGFGLIPFVVLVGTYIAAFAVPFLIGGALVLFALLSFWPLLLVLLPFFFAGAAALLVLAVAVWLVATTPRLRRVLPLAKAYAWFLLPLYPIFACVAAALFSVPAALAVGACFFIQGEVLWDRRQPLQRRPDVVKVMNMVIKPVFDYFPLSVYRSVAATADDAAAEEVRETRRVAVDGAASSASSRDFGMRQRRGQTCDSETKGDGKPPEKKGTAKKAKNHRSPDSVHWAETLGALSSPQPQPGGHDGDALAKPALFCYHPHGVYAFGLWSLIFDRASGFARVFPRPLPPAQHGGNDAAAPDPDGAAGPGPAAENTGRRRRGLFVGVASSVLHMPLVGQLFAALGFIPASRTCLAKACATEDDVAIIPGGIAEMVAASSDPDIETVYLAKRRGFVRLALATGRPLVPVYGFGESRTFHQYTFCRKLREIISRRLRVIVQLFRGRWFTLVPFAVPVKVVVGEPLVVPHVNVEDGPPPPELVEAVHAAYVARVQRLFEENKHRHQAYARAKLVVV